MKKFSRYLILVLLVFPLLAALPATSAQSDELTFWMKKSFVEPSNEAIEARVAQFEQETGIEVNLEIIAYEDALPRWSAAIESGNVPDVSFFGYQEVGQFYGQGLLLDVTDLLAEIQAANGSMVEALVAPVTFEEKQWAIPFWSEATVLYYRTDLFEKAGLEGAPETWEQFLEYARELTDPAAGVYGAGYGIGRGNSDSEWWFRDLLWSHGAYLFNETGDQAAINSEEGALVFNWIKDFFNTERVTPPGVIGWDDGGNNQAYLSGQAAMVMNVGSIYYALVNDRPDLLEVTGIGLVPGGPEGRYIAGISNNIGIFKDSDNPEQAKQLIAYMLDKEWVSEWVKTAGFQVVPVYPDLAEDEFWQSEAGQVFIETPQYYLFLGAEGSFSPVAGAVYNSRLLTDALESVIVSGTSVEDALAKLESDINELFAD